MTPTINYQNNINFNNNISNLNEINFSIIKRDKSQSDLPSDNNSLKANNYLIFNKKLKNINSFNKLTLLNSYNNYIFEGNESLNRDESSNHLIISSDLYLNSNQIIKPRLKFIINQNIHSSEKIVNEDSNSITFNYLNSFSDNRFFGTDLRDNTSRIVYGIESEFNLHNQNIELNLSQSYDLKKNNNFSNKINQKDHLSDLALEGNTRFRDINLKIDARLDKSSLGYKELNLILNTLEPINMSLNYHETDNSAFSENSNDTEYLGINFDKEINDYISLSYGSNFDLKNN